jgi:RNA polymerase sigma factor (sigma-70 family)
MLEAGGTSTLEQDRPLRGRPCASWNRVAAATSCAGGGGSRRPTARDVGNEPPDAHELERLVLAAADGDESAWATLVRQFAGGIRAAARMHRLAPHDVDDVLQSTWMRLVECIEHLREPAAVAGWLNTTARRESLHLVQRAARVRPTGDELSEGEREEAGPIDRLIGAERRRAVSEALAELPDRERTLLSFMLTERASSYAEISLALGMPVGSIGPTRGRALTRLRRDRRLRALMSADASPGKPPSAPREVGKK